MSDLKTLKDLDHGTYKIDTVYQDPRRGVIPGGGKHRIYVLSFPDRELARKWGADLGAPKKWWDEERKRLEVKEPYISQALQLPKAPKDVLEATLPVKRRP